jgi:tetratricopeptide (TPR) repeat protein
MVHIFRAEAYLQEHKPDRSIAELNTALTTERGMSSAMAASVFALRSLGWEMSGQGEHSVDDLDRAMKALNGDNLHDYSVLNTRCYIAAVAGLLDSAIESCNDSISRHSRDQGAYDSRGFTELKQHDWDHAIADYTQELYYRPDLSLSLYGRGIARQAKGDRAGSDADLAAAKANEPQVVDIMARLGVPPDLGKAPSRPGK